MQTLLHTADLGNPCKPWKIHIQWTHAIVAEFFSQGDLERSEGKPISPMCDRNENCGRSSQKNFIKFFVRPLFVLCGEVTARNPPPSFFLREILSLSFHPPALSLPFSLSLSLSFPLSLCLLFFLSLSSLSLSPFNPPFPSPFSSQKFPMCRARR
jgi:hypothetical protein